MSFELVVEKAELTFGLVAQLFEDQWKVTAKESSSSSILPQLSVVQFWPVPNNLFCRSLEKRKQSDSFKGSSKHVP